MAVDKLNYKKIVSPPTGYSPEGEDIRFLVNGRPSKLAPVYGDNDEVVGLSDTDGSEQPLGDKFRHTLNGLLGELLKEKGILSAFINGAAETIGNNPPGTLENMLARMTGNFHD